MKQTELAEILDNWFKTHKNIVRKCDNPVWVTLKNNLKTSHHWKDAPRGWPQAYKTTQNNLNSDDMWN